MLRALNNKSNLIYYLKKFSLFKYHCILLVVLFGGIKCEPLCPVSWPENRMSKKHIIILLI